MKKLQLSVLYALLCILPLCANSQNDLQIFLPKTVHVGDIAELRYIFHSDIDFFTYATPQASNTPARIELHTQAFADMESRCYIKSAVLERVANEYTLTLTIVPWKAGTLVFAPFDLASLLHPDEMQTLPLFEIALKPVTIHSLADELQETTLRPPAAPLTIPGTTAILIVLAIFFCALFAALITLLVKLPAISGFFVTSYAVRFARRQTRITIKQLTRLQKAAAKNAMSAEAFCEKLQHILRTFLKKRYTENFAACATPALYETFTTAAGDSLTEAQEQAMQTLVAVFKRTDYVRFAHDSTNWTEKSPDTLIDEASKSLLLLLEATC